MTRTLVAALVLAMPVLSGALAGPVSAQSLPEWAAPSGPAPTAEGPSASLAPPPPPPPPTQVPLDGGLVLLGAAGAAYGVRRLRQARRA